LIATARPAAQSQPKGAALSYAKLPFEVPGVTGPLAAPNGTAPGDGTQPGPVRLRELPARAGARVQREHAARKRPGKRRTPRTIFHRRSKLLDGLTDDQRAAVTHGEGPLLIFAGPGTGKTHTLAVRIAYLAEQRLARLSQIVAVTFTVRAADEMRLRLIELLGIEKASYVTVCTIHSLCHRILRGNGGGYGRDQDFWIADSAAIRQLVRAILARPASHELRQELENAPFKPANELLASVVEQISWAKNNLWEPEEYLENSTAPTKTLVTAAWSELDARLAAGNAFGFDDLLVCTAHLLASDEDLREHYAERYRWMLIDEFQDTNVAQMAIVRLLMAPAGNLTVVGDDDQALYAWRAADAEHNILAFRRWFTDPRTVTLTENRRSRREIVELALRLIGHNQRREPKQLIPIRPGGAFTGVRFYPTEEEEAADIGDLIESELAQGRKPGEIVVLCRNMNPLRHLQQRLQERGIKVRLVGGVSMWERSEIRDAIAHLAVVANPLDRTAFARAIGAPRDRTPFEQGNVDPPTRGAEKALKALYQFAEQQRADLIDAMLRADEIAEIGEPEVVALREYAAALDRIRRRMWVGGPLAPSVGAIVDQTLRMPGGPIATYTLLRDHAKNHSVREDANRVLQDLHSLSRAAHAYEETTVDVLPTLAGFLASLDLDDGQEVGIADDDRVTLSTMHGAKGTEKETVIVIAFEEDLLPDFRATGNARSIEEERRLAYNAITRAKDNLMFTYVATRFGIPTSGPSQFAFQGGLL
jgi:DNA helicase II / ATP-dependent DNA helicase PcrA